MAILKVGGTQIASSSGSDVTLDNVALGSSVTGISTAGTVHLATYTADPAEDAEIATFNLGDYASYGTHILRFENVRNENDSLNCTLRLGTSATPITLGYTANAHRIYGEEDDNPTVAPHYNHAHFLYLSVYAGNATGEPGFSGEVSIFGALSATLRTSGRGHLYEWKGDGYTEAINSWGEYNTAVATPYLHIVSNAGDFESGKIILYGVNNA